MKTKEEKAYFAYLEKIIREQKAKSSFWQRETNSYEMDILMLMNHIAKKNPHLADRIVGNFIDTTKIKDYSKKDILSFMSQTEKGTICKWKNEEGEEIYLVNNGRNFFKPTKQILVFGNHVSKGDLELLKKSMYGQVLKKDIQKVYEKIAREEQRKIERKGKILYSVADKISDAKKKTLEHTATDFEKNFKELVREQGSLCIPRATANTMLAFMPVAEKRKLGEGLTRNGITGEGEWERLLEKWKNEALHPEYKIERSYTRTIKSKTVEVLHSR